jgi:hypothetical protein
VGWEVQQGLVRIGERPLPSPPHEPRFLYQQNLRVDVTEVLWPPSPKGITNILFGCYIAKNWPPSWWAYTNTPGIFFLTKKNPRDNKEWTKLGRFDDWIEPTTNAPSVQAAIKEIKVRGQGQTVENDFFDLTSKRLDPILCSCHASCDWNFPAQCIM